MRKVKIPSFILFFALFSITSYSKPINKINQENNSSINKLLDKISYSKKDFKTAKKIHLVFKQAEKNRLKLRSLRKTRNLILKNKTFKIFKPWINNLIKTYKVNNLHSFFSTCSSTFNDEVSSSAMKVKLKKQLLNICSHRFIKVLFKEHGKILNYKNLQQFIKNNVSHFLKSKNILYFIKLLKVTESKKGIHHFLSKTISNYYIQSDKTPHPRIVKHLIMTPSFTGHIQRKGYRQFESNRVLLRELRRLSRTTLKEAKSKKQELFQSSVNKFVNYYSLNRSHLPGLSAWRIITSLAKDLLYLDHKKQSKKLFLLALDSSPSNKKQESLFNHLWFYWHQHDYIKAANIINKNSLLKKFSSLSSKLKFWISYTFQKTGNTVLARKYLESLINEDPLDFYSILGSKSLLSLSQKKNTSHKLIDLYDNNHVDGLSSVNVSFSKYALSSLKRLKLWSKLNAGNLIKYESIHINNMKQSEVFKKEIFETQEEVSAFLNLVSANILNKSSSYLNSFYIIYNALSKNILKPNLTILKSLFPEPYKKLLLRYQGSVDDDLLYSLIRQESAFNPNARSHAGATGLMQLMPATARRYQRRIRSKQLKNPRTNIRIGMKYVKYLVKKYNGNLVYTLAAYNAGETNLHRWRKKIFKGNPSLLHTIESIPFNETRLYVKLIFRNLFFYKFLEGERKDSSKLNKIFDLNLGFKH